MNSLIPVLPLTQEEGGCRAQSQELARLLPCSTRDKLRNYLD